MDGNFEVVLMYNLRGIMNNLWSLQAFPSALPVLLYSREGGKAMIDSWLHALEL